MTGVDIIARKCASPYGLRRLVQPAVSPKEMRGYRDRIEQVVERLVDDLVRRRDADLVSAFAAPLPIAVITELLGVPDAEAATFARYGVEIAGALDGIRSLGHARRLLAANDALATVFDGLLELRRREPAGPRAAAPSGAYGVKGLRGGLPRVAWASAVHVR